MNDGFIGKTPIVLNNIKPGKHTLTLSSSGYVTAEQEIEIINGIKEEVAVRLSKPDSRESFNRSVISELWKNEFIHQLEKSIDEYKIFWDISFERYIKTTLGINMLRKISTKMLLDKSGKWAYGEVVGEIKCEAIRYMSQNNYFLEKFEKAAVSLDHVLKCEICQEQFRPLDTHPGFYEASNGLVKCCRSCLSQCIWRMVPNIKYRELYQTKYQRENMLVDLFRLYELAQSVPPINFDQASYLFFKSAPEKNRTDLFRHVYKMRSYKDYIEMFSSWFRALVESGIIADGAIKMARGIKCLALDKHLCLSLLEKQVDDWLFFNKIEHSIEPKYPKHDIYNPNMLMRADFLVKDVFIEVWGLKGIKPYEMKIEKKRKLVKEKLLKLIEIEPQDIENLDDKLQQLLI